MTQFTQFMGVYSHPDDFDRLWDSVYLLLVIPFVLPVQIARLHFSRFSAAAAAAADEQPKITPLWLPGHQKQAVLNANGKYYFVKFKFKQTAQLLTSPTWLILKLGAKM